LGTAAVVGGAAAETGDPTGLAAVGTGEVARAAAIAVRLAGTGGVGPTTRGTATAVVMVGR